ncbi:MAG: hypothetical protein ACYC8T_34525 [Myxococcaceae bacterium]
MRLRLLMLLALAACNKVPIVQVQAGFELADATWFEAERTLFIFYTASAEQGIGPESVIELSYETDDGIVTWTEIGNVPAVHTHVAAQCQQNALCGSTSVQVDKVPRNIGIRLRYSRRGEMALDAPVRFNVVGTGPAFSNRSLLVYGVFDETNTHAQWRARHVFPTLRNEQVTALGLRRSFMLTDERYGTIPEAALPNAENPYGYGFAPACPADFLRTDQLAPVQTTDRAVFDGAGLPLAAVNAVQLCATSTVTDATGTFVAMALARKNPEVRPAFPALRSPIRSATQLPFVLRPCRRTISDPHLAMQQQRLRWTDAGDTVCTDDWNTPGFLATLVSRFSTRIDLVRAAGNDLILTVALHHDETTGGLATALETALEQVLSTEAAKSSPRAAGAFVLDSYPHIVRVGGLERRVLWCPAPMMSLDAGFGGDASSKACALQPDLPPLNLGPFSFGMIPILPTRDKYLTFIGQYSDAQAGQVTKLDFRTPERTPASENVEVGSYGVVTFFNSELISAAPTDAFSYCPVDPPPPVAFRSASFPGLAPLSALPQVHRLAPASTYQLGLAWDFPYLMRLDYQIVIAGSASAFSLTVPFGIAADTTAYYGTQLWAQGEFPLSEALLQCTRFCDQPTFDSAGVYQVTARFHETYGDRCYRPLYPTPAGGGFPLDP